MTKPSVSIGITAFNEERTIKSLLNSLLNQQELNFRLKEIIVISDGCTDATTIQVRQVKSKKLFLIDDQKRQGKTARLNQLFKSLTGDIIIFADADISLANDTVIDEMVKVFLSHPDTGLVSARIYPKQPKTFLGNAVFASVNAYVSYAESINNGNNIYTCKGPLIGLSKRFARKTIIPHNIFAEMLIFIFLVSAGVLNICIPKTPLCIIIYPKY